MRDTGAHAALAAALAQYLEKHAMVTWVSYPGRAVQVDPIKPKLKPPGTKPLILKCDGLLSNFGFKFKLRRYTPACPPTRSTSAPSSTSARTATAPC